MSTLLLAAVVAFGYYDMPNQVNGAYYSSCNTSYCRSGAVVNCTPQARVSSILNKPTGYGYSVTYNYGLQPQPANHSWSAASNSYNHGSYRMK